MILGNYGGNIYTNSARTANSKQPVAKGASFEDALQSAFTSVGQEEAEFAKTLQSWHTRRPF